VEVVYDSDAAQVEQVLAGAAVAGAAALPVPDLYAECYEGLTKAELRDQLAERDLPKTGNVAELAERLVEADSK
jgi:SAP domain